VTTNPSSANERSPKEEAARLAVLHSYRILDTPSESEYDDPAQLAAEVCQVPIALVTFIDEDRVWVKAAVGTEIHEVSRSESLCALTLDAREMVLVPDTFDDPRTASSRMVKSPEAIRFYAGAPLVSPQGHILGTICVMDRRPRRLSDGQERALEAIGRLVMARLEFRKTAIHLKEVVETHEIVEQGLADSRQRLQTVVDTAGEGITFSDERGHFEVFNRAMEQITGYTHAEANAAKDFSRLLYPEEEDRQRALDGLKELLAKGSMREVETSIMTKSGERKTLLVSTTIVSLASGKMFLSMYHDITERTKAFEAARESRERFRVMFESSPIPAWVFDSDSLRFLEVNDAMVRQYGFSREELLAMEITEIRPPEEIPRLTNTLREIRYRPAHHTTAVHMAKDGRIFEVRISWNTFWYEGRRAVLVVAEDITEQQRHAEELRSAKEAAERADRAKTEFLATMSHELRTPLNGVIGTTSLLMDTTLTPEQREYVQTIRESGVGLLTVINDILMLARLEAVPGEIEETTVSVEQAIETALEMFSGDAERKNLQLVSWVEWNVPLAIRTDGTRLRQVLVNLISNAVKFTERGRIAVTAAVKGRAAEHVDLEWTVADTGPGIPAERLDRLFKPFSQVDMSDTRQHGGTGLGLAIAARIAERLGGSIRVESTLGRGSSFIVSMRAKLAETSEPRPQYAIAGKNIWIIVQDPLQRKVLRDLVTRHGAGCVIAATYEELSTFESAEARPHVVVADTEVAFPSGDDLVHKVWEKFGGLVPFAILCFPDRAPQPEDWPRESIVLLGRPLRHRTFLKTISDLIAGKQQPDMVSSTAIPGLPASLRILVAEDNAVNQKLILRILKKLGYEADLAANGLEALDAVRRQPYDVIFMDIQMPQMDGVEATRRLLAEAPIGRRPNVLAMTAHVSDENRQRCAEAGMVDFLTKPVMIDDVRAALERLMGTIVPPGGSQKTKPLQDPDIRERLEEFGGASEVVFIRQLVQAFLHEVPLKLDGIDQAIAHGDSQMLQEEAHALKGSSMNIGAKRLGELAKELETLGRTKGKIGPEASTRELREEFDSVQQQLLSYVRSFE